MTAVEALATAKTRWDDARAEVEDARVGLEYAVRDAVNSGSMSQADVARSLGWPRQRVNTVLKGGKAP